MSSSSGAVIGGTYKGSGQYKCGLVPEAHRITPIKGPSGMYGTMVLIAKRRMYPTPNCSTGLDRIVMYGLVRSQSMQCNYDRTTVCVCARACVLVFVCVCACVRVYSCVYVCKWRFLESFKLGRRLGLGQPQKVCKCGFGKSRGRIYSGIRWVLCGFKGRCNWRFCTITTTTTTTTTIITTTTTTIIITTTTITIFITTTTVTTITITDNNNNTLFRPRHWKRSSEGQKKRVSRSHVRSIFLI